MAEAAVLRSTHCPFGYGLPDAALDRFLLDQADALGAAFIQIQREDGRRERLRVALMAQAGNGGAIIDSRARTNIDGLYAVGECATGMHGANRIGGAMVASCLVFGARAGRDAAESLGGPSRNRREFEAALARTMQGCCRDIRERNATRRWLADCCNAKACRATDAEATTWSRVWRTSCGWQGIQGRKHAPDGAVPRSRPLLRPPADTD